MVSEYAPRRPLINATTYRTFDWLIITVFLITQGYGSLQPSFVFGLGVHFLCPEFEVVADSSLATKGVLTISSSAILLSGLGSTILLTMSNISIKLSVLQRFTREANICSILACHMKRLPTSPRFHQKNSSMITTPPLHVSAGYPDSSPSNTSGAMYPSVPTLPLGHLLVHPSSEPSQSR